MTTDTPRPDPAHEDDTVEFRTSRCPYCGKHGSVRDTLDDPARRAVGDLIQAAFPEMPERLRERIASGAHPDCYAAMFPGTEDDDQPDDESAAGPEPAHDLPPGAPSTSRAARIFGPEGNRAVDRLLSGTRLADTDAAERPSS